jgi:hypothetical protein
MLTVSDTTSSASSALLAAGTSTQSSSSAASQSFEQQLLQIIENSLESLGIDPSKLNVKLQSSASTATASSASQLLVTYDTPATASSSSTTSADSTGDTTPDTSFGAKTVDGLKQALKDAGMDPDKYGLEYQEELEFFPTGNFTSKFIKATLGDGSTQYYSANLTAECPSSTVLSMQHDLRDIAAGVTT